MHVLILILAALCFGQTRLNLPADTYGGPISPDGNWMLCTYSVYDTSNTTYTYKIILFNMNTQNYAELKTEQLIIDGANTSGKFIGAIGWHPDGNRITYNESDYNNYPIHK